GIQLPHLRLLRPRRAAGARGLRRLTDGRGALHRGRRRSRRSFQGPWRPRSFGHAIYGRRGGPLLTGGEGTGGFKGPVRSWEGMDRPAPAASAGPCWGHLGERPQHAPNLRARSNVGEHVQDYVDRGDYDRNESEPADGYSDESVRPEVIAQA